jgi:hypothetical protein
MKIHKLFFSFSFLLIVFCASAQIKPARQQNESMMAGGKDTASAKHSVGALETRELFKRKGIFFFYWGYNRAAFSNSDIHFWGDGYDFKITNVMALDEPDPISKEYIGPTTFTIPQYNYRVGY